METPLKNFKNKKEQKNFSYIKKMFWALSPSMTNKNKSIKSSLKSQNIINYSFYPQISNLTNSFLFKNKKKIKKRNSTETIISKIKYLNSYESKEGIIYCKKLFQKNKINNNNIITAVRIRPISSNEKLISSEIMPKIENKNTLLIKDSYNYYSSSSKNKFYKFSSFDYLFDSNEDQKSIFNSVVKKYIKDIINGKNITILTYGPRYSGKTYTMFGTIKNPGIIPNTLKEIFESIKLYKTREYKIKMSYYKIYNNKIIDLLNNEAKKENKKIQEMNIINLNEKDDIFSIISTKENNNNIQTFHKVVQIIIKYKENAIEKFGRINFVDSGGTEELYSFYNDKKDLELEFIKSKKNLENNSKHIYEYSSKENNNYIDFKNNKFAILLKDLIENNSKIIFIANISYNYDETIKALKFAEKIKNQNYKNDKFIENYASPNLNYNNLNEIKKHHSNVNSLKNILKSCNDKNSEIKINKSSSTQNYQESIKKMNNEQDNSGIEKYYKKDFEIIKQANIIKENNLELETSDLNGYMSEKEDKKFYSLIDNFVQQSQAEVKIKQKIMGIYYEIYLLNNSIKEKIEQKKIVSNDKKKLKSLKKILNKNIQCFDSISQKNKNLFQKYFKNNENNLPKKDGNIYENDNDVDFFHEKIELNEMQKRYIYLVAKVCKLQKENIEIKYNYILIQGELSKKDKIIKDLEKQIELKDLNINKNLYSSKEQLIKEELDENYKLLLSLQQKSKTLRENNIDSNKYEIKLDNDLDDEILSYKTHENNSSRKRKHFSFHPRNSSRLKSYTISNYLKSKNSGSPIKNLLMPRKIEMQTESRKDNDDNNIDEELNLYHFDKNLFSPEYNDIIGKEFNEIIKNFNIEEKTELNFGIKSSHLKKLKDVINEDEGGEETNNKTLKSILNDIQIANSNINNRLNIIEKSPNASNELTIKPINRIMFNENNLNNLLNNKDKENINKNSDINNKDYKNKKSLTKPYTDKKQKKRKIKNCSIEVNYNSPSNNKDLRLMKNEINLKKDNNEIINKKDSSEITSPNLIISVNLKNKNKKLSFNSSLMTNFNRNDINFIESKTNTNKYKKNIDKKTKKKIKEDKDNKKITNQKNTNKVFSYEKDNNIDNLKQQKKIRENAGNQNIQKNNLTISKMKDDEKLKLQIFYSKHLNNYRTNKQKKIFSNENINMDNSKNGKTSLYNIENSALLK